MAELPDETRPAYTLTVAEHRAILREELAALRENHEPAQREDDVQYTTTEAAWRLRCSRRHLYSLIRRGRIRATRVGDPERGRMLISAAEINRIASEVSR